MADQTNPLCERRLAEMETGQKDLSKQVEAHDDKLIEHSGRISAVEETVKAMATTVMNSDKSLAVIASSVEAIKAEVIRINGWQVKLISFFAIVLAILAGVEEAHKIGLF